MYRENSHSQGTSGEGFQSSSQIQGQMRCANCDIEILWPPIIVQGKIYCCTGCAAGGPCSCDYSQYRSVNVSGIIHYHPALETGTETEKQLKQQ